MVYCRECGELNRDGANYCFKCGSPLRGSEGEDTRPQPARMKAGPRTITLTASDDTENLGRLTPEILRMDTDTLMKCNDEIKELVKKRRIRRDDFEGSMEELMAEIRSRLEALSGELRALSPQLLRVTVEIDRSKPDVKITTSLDKDRMEGYLEKIKSRQLSDQSPAAPSWRDLCPVCREAPLTPFPKRRIPGGSKRNMRCSNCGAVFMYKGNGYLLSRVSDRNTRAWRLYGGKTLTEEEWTRIANGGVSNELQREIQRKRDIEERRRDIEGWLKSAAEGNVTFREPQTPIILRKNERAVLVLHNIDLYEPRAVRRTAGGYGGPTIRVSKNLSFRMGALNAISESRDELRRIDTGTLTLTTRRMIFTGTKRTTNIDLRKVLAIQPYTNGIAVQRENKKRTEHFLNTEKTLLNITHSGRTHTIPADGAVMKAVIEGLIRKL